MDYEYTRYENFEGLKKNEPKLAKLLLNEVDKGEWMNEELYVYPDIEEFAKYELSEGWYCDHNFDDDYNGAPNPFDYIDMKAFGAALERRWDESCNIDIDGKIVTTGYGW